VCPVEIAVAGSEEGLGELGWSSPPRDSPHTLTRVNSTNVLDEGLRIGETGRRMNSKVRLIEIDVYQK
jgi:hypothetical protein